MTKRILPEPELLRQLIDYDPETGKLYWKERPERLFTSSRMWKSWNSRYAGKEAFTAYLNGYKQGMIFYSTLYAHRVAWAIFYGEWPEDQIDHINCDRSDNRIKNLRGASLTENNRNTLISSNNTSGVKGVSMARSGRWVAKIRDGNKNIHLGTFDSIDEAAEAYSCANLKYHGSFSRVE